MTEEKQNDDETRTSFPTPLSILKQRHRPSSASATTNDATVNAGLVLSQSPGFGTTATATKNVESNKTRMSTNCSTATATATSNAWFIRLAHDMRLLCLEVPILVLFTVFVFLLLVQDLFQGPVTKLINAREIQGGFNDQNFYNALDSDITYYNRQCTSQDISTNDANDLLLPNANTTTEQAVDTMMKHGAVMFQNVLTKDTATKLRAYLEGRHKIQSQLPWHEKFFEERGRLSLGLGAVHDHPIITQALQEVGKHQVLKQTIQGILGEDPAIAEISTLTTMYGAEDQGIHTDTDFFGSSVLYTRTFLHSYTMFMALQDTTSRMGATTICPGTHHCANEDLEQVCLENGAFEVSSNGKTGRNVGVLYQGDAMMFDQNVWHRGPTNYDPNFPNTNRVMFIVTFISRTAHEPSDYRQQGLGTYYYQRWNHWGHTFQDLQDSVKRTFHQPFATLRSLGIYKFASAHWGITWLEHFAQQIGNRGHFYADYELPDFRYYLETHVWWLPKSIYSNITVRQWEPFLHELLQNLMEQVQTWYLVVLSVYVILHVLIWGMQRMARIGAWIATNMVGNNKDKDEHDETPLPLATKKHNAWIPKIVLKLLLYHAIIAWMFLLLKGFIYQTDFYQWIESGQVNIKPFPDYTEQQQSSSYSSLHYDKSSTLSHFSLRRTTVPERDDVLIGTRYDTDFLGSKNYQLDYHPGNQRFAQMIQRVLPATSTNMSSLPIMLDTLCETLIQQIQTYNFGNSGYGPIRFLLQEYTNGHWILLNDDHPNDLYRFVRQSILMASNPIVKGLARHLKSILAMSRFGARRESYYERIMTPAIVQTWQRIVFEENDDDILDAKSSMTTTRTRTTNSKRQLYSIATFASIPPVTVPKRPLRTNSILFGTEKLRQEQEQQYVQLNKETGHYHITVRTGDHIVRQGSYGFDHGRIVHISSPNDALFVSFSTGSVDPISNENIRFYEPLNEGDVVLVQYYEERRRSYQWAYAEIDQASPFGTYRVQYLDDGSYDDGKTFSELFKISSYNHNRHTAPTKTPPPFYVATFEELEEDEYEPLEIGQRVRSNYQQEGEWFSGTIQSRHLVQDRLVYEIIYDDGDYERHVERRHVAPINA